jgi:hypothetical protein
VVNTCVFVAHPNAVWNGLTSHYDYFYHLERGLDLLGEGGADCMNEARLEARVFDEFTFLDRGESFASF